jgi:hypothetical protein
VCSGVVGVGVTGTNGGDTGRGKGARERATKAMIFDRNRVSLNFSLACMC